MRSQSNKTEPTPRGNEDALKSSPRRPRRDVIILGITVSLFIHLLLVGGIFWLGGFENQKIHPEKKRLAVKLVSPKPPVRPENDLPKQVVSIPKPKEQIKPKKAELASEFNSSVSEETKSRVTSLIPEKLSETVQKGVQPQKQDTPKSSQMPQSADKQPPQKQLFTKKDGLLPKESSERGDLLSKLIPTWKDKALESAAPFSDHLKNIEEDSATRLNTWEWVHAPFFRRIKESVARRWDPNGAIRRNDPSGRVVGKNDRVTQVLVKISKDGELLSLKVVRESGVYFLDDEAVNAFKQAAPFSNPPKELFASHDSFEFPFGFMLSYNKGFKFDLDWRPY